MAHRRAVLCFLFIGRDLISEAASASWLHRRCEATWRSRAVCPPHPSYPFGPVASRADSWLSRISDSSGPLSPSSLELRDTAARSLASLPEPRRRAHDLDNAKPVLPTSVWLRPHSLGPGTRWHVIRRCQPYPPARRRSSADVRLLHPSTPQ